MLFRRCLVLLLMIATIISMAACGKDDNAKADPNDPFFGKWEEAREDGIANVFDFWGDGKGQKQNLVTFTDFAYTYTDKVLTITLHLEGEEPIVREYEYRFENGDLYLKPVSDTAETVEERYVKVKK